MDAKRFANIWKGIFFLLASLSLVIVMVMFIFVWQPIWTAGFKDFHTISAAISKLNDTTKPSSEVAPLMLKEMTKMNGSLGHIENTMLTIDDINKTMKVMSGSIRTIEDLNPNIIRMNYTMEQMNMMLSGQMGRMNYEVDQMGDKLSPFGMMPFNW